MKKLDRFTAMCIGGALVAVVLSMIMDGASPAALLKPAPLILVFGGTIAVGAAGLMKKDVKSIKQIFKLALGVPETDPAEDIARLVNLADVARRDGLLALEQAAGEIDDPFLAKGIQMTVDGVDSDEIEEILETEIAAMKERHKAGAKFFADMGGYAPTLGIIGTVIGLIHVLGNLSNPNALGPAIGSAFTATLWGVMSANLFWLPISNKLKRASELEVSSKRMILAGLLAVQAGSTPRMVATRLQAYRAASERADEAA
ncbi:MotA/TolQ/ExbB proton channel family protein [Acidiferrimicrobium sp. IK]|uniref:motility protein A n=1 Tax=Acidiferrimicrobium sp. IK TaxID=2871700 RepID=UPI0021CB7BCC|nr:MotA/TolQ/ExbB proton channel family protein [Acidiferrimicrobium sp. IK]MCU4185041.1 MotA/TolQ/ExbB proton channel family protein [Acidiferrimicrobium sp. IK]